MRGRLFPVKKISELESKSADENFSESELESEPENKNFRSRSRVSESKNLTPQLPTLHLPTYQALVFFSKQSSEELINTIVGFESLKVLSDDAFYISFAIAVKV